MGKEENIMPAGRIILKSISESRKMFLLKTDSARLLFTWLIPHLDKNGCFSGDAEVVNGRIFTRLKKTTEEVEGWLADLETTGLINRYKVNEDIFLNVPDFKEKQPYLNPEREGKPKYPEPENHDLFMSKSAPGADLIRGSLAKEKEKEKVKEKENTWSNDFDLFWKEYPKRVHKEDSMKAFFAIRRAGITMEKIIQAFNGYMEVIRIEERPLKYIMYPASFLRKYKEWENDYIGVKGKPPL